jgi:hypothetical protein
VRSAGVERRRATVVAFGLVVGFALGLVAAPASADARETKQRVKTTEDTIVEISGEKTPEQLPEYLVWKIGLRALAAIKKQNIEPAVEELGLSPPDGEFVFAEGRAQQERDRDCFERQERLTTMLRAAEAKAERIVAETRAIVLECRWATLEAKERMLAGLSPDAQMAVNAWVLNQRRQINVTVHRAELEFFRQPR